VVERKAPKSFAIEVRDWLDERTQGRASRRPTKPPGIP